MEDKHTTKVEVMREVAANLRGMVPETKDGNLSFRLAEKGEPSLNSRQRRKIGRYYSRGHNDDFMAGVLSTW